MANVLPFEKQCRIVHALAECNSIRAIERQTGVHRDTVMRLGLRVGIGCAKILDETMRDLPCKEVEIDEIWGFVGKKQKYCSPEDEQTGLGDCWVYVAYDRDSKVVPSFVVGKRDLANTHKFGIDLASRMRNRIALFSDGSNDYIDVIQQAFGERVDYGQVVKTFTHQEAALAERKFSPPPMTKARRRIICGEPDREDISTSHVEANNMVMRTHIRRMVRLTNAHSKKLENMKAAIALHFAYFNLTRTHSTIKMTPAMALGIEPTFWSIQQLTARAFDSCPAITSDD
jgi:IS1 family transposase